MARQEKTYQTELKRSFDFYVRSTNQFGLWWKIPDTGYTKNPYDSWCLLGGKYYAMEQKICKTVGTFNFKTFFRDREHELDSLERVEKAGGVSYVTVNHYIPRKVNTAYAFPASVARRAHSKGKGIKLEDIQRHPQVIEIPRIKSDINEWIWDLSVLFK